MYGARENEQSIATSLVEGEAAACRFTQSFVDRAKE